MIDPIWVVDKPRSWNGQRGETVEIFYSQSKRHKPRLVFRIILSYLEDSLYTETAGSMMNWFSDKIPQKHKMKLSHHKVSSNGQVQDEIVDYVYTEYDKFFKKLDGIPFEDATTKIKGFTTRLLKKASKIR